MVAGHSFECGIASGHRAAAGKLLYVRNQVQGGQLTAGNRSADEFCKFVLATAAEALRRDADDLEREHKQAIEEAIKKFAALGGR